MDPFNHHDPQSSWITHNIINEDNNQPHITARSLFISSIKFILYVFSIMCVSIPIVIMTDIYQNAFDQSGFMIIIVFIISILLIVHFMRYKRLRKVKIGIKTVTCITVVLSIIIGAYLIDHRDNLDTNEARIYISASLGDLAIPAYKTTFEIDKHDNNKIFVITTFNDEPRLYKNICIAMTQISKTSLAKQLPNKRIIHAFYIGQSKASATYSFDEDKYTLYIDNKLYDNY